MAHNSHPLSPTRSRNGSRWFAASEQAEKNTPVKIHQGLVSGDPDLVLHLPRLADSLLVMGLPLL